MKRALVLSGGGAKGGFQYGALDYLVNRNNYDFDIIAGVSVGALNATLLAQNDLKLLGDFWYNITEKSIMHGSRQLWDIIWRIFKKRLSIYNNKPLQDLIDKSIDVYKIPLNRELVVGVVNYNTGAYHSVSHRSPYFKQFLLASTAIPIAFPPTKIQHGGETLYYFDGGARNVCPLQDVLKYNPEEIIIINCSDPDFMPERKDKPKSMADLASRAVDVLTNEVFKNDLMVQIPKGIDTVLIEPTKSLGETLDFSRDKLNMRIRHGFERAQEILSA